MNNETGELQRDGFVSKVLIFMFALVLFDVFCLCRGFPGPRRLHCAQGGLAQITQASFGSQNLKAHCWPVGSFDHWFIGSVGRSFVRAFVRAFFHCCLCMLVCGSVCWLVGRWVGGSFNCCRWSGPELWSRLMQVCRNTAAECEFSQFQIRTLH